MNLDDYRTLREIFSLITSIGRLKADISKEQSRMVNLHQRNEQALQERLTIDTQIKQLNQELNHIDYQLNQRLSEDMKTKLETTGLQVMEKIDQHQESLKNLTSFLQGLKNTISEIESEVSTFTQGKNQEIESHQHRIDQLKSQLPQEVQLKFEQLMVKNLPIGPFTSNQGGKCQFCLRTLSKIEESEIDVKLLLKTCPSCGRIFLPYGVLHS